MKGVGEKVGSMGGSARFNPLAGAGAKRRKKPALNSERSDSVRDSCGKVRDMDG